MNTNYLVLLNIDPLDNKWEKCHMIKEAIVESMTIAVQYCQQGEDEFYNRILYLTKEKKFVAIFNQTYKTENDYESIMNILS